MFVRDKYSYYDPYLVAFAASPFTVVDNGLYHVDASGGNITLNLPDIDGRDGRFVRVLRIDTTITNYIRVVPFGTQLINGQSYVDITRIGEHVGYVSRSGNWYYDYDAGSAAGESNLAYFNPSAAKDYIEIGSTSLVLFSSFLYRGSAVWTPSYLVALLSRSKVDGTASIRLWDSTHSLQICSYSWSTMTKDIHIISPLTNIPRSLSAFEMQASCSSASAGAARVHAIGLYP